MEFEKIEDTIAAEPRLDQLGFVNELVKHYHAPLNALVKAQLRVRGFKRATGEYFDGLIVDATPQSIDTAKFLKLYEAGELTRAQYLSCVSVKREPAEQFLSGLQIDQISNPLKPYSALYVNRIKTVEMTLVEAVRGLALVIK